MSDSSHVSKWLKAKTGAQCTNIIDPSGSISNTWHEGAAAIHKFWVSFWDNLHEQIPASHERQEALLEGVEMSQTVQISFPTGIQLQSRAQSGSGAAGPDGWKASEIKHLPLNAFETMADLFQIFVTDGNIPIQLQQARMCCLPKPGKICNDAVKAADARPITIMSTWWRLWASTLCTNSDVRNWLQQTLLPSVGGITKQDIYQNLIEIHDAFHQQGYVLTLDYSKAFDCIDSSLSCQLLKKHGWPPPLVDLLGLVWGKQYRFVQWNHHTHHIPLAAANIQPQGDPLGPIIMTLWVQSGIHSVAKQCEIPDGSFTTKTYLDDRTVTTTSTNNLQKLHSCWTSWSKSVGLLENLDKGKISAVGQSRLTLTSQSFPPSMVSPAVRILGSVSRAGPRTQTSEENQRLNDAKACARLLGCCAFPMPLHLRYLRQFALPKAVFGWVARGPTWTDCKSLFTCFWVTSQRVRYSSPWLRALFLGGNSHLDIAWVTRLIAGVFRYRLAKGRPPSWTLGLGTCAHSLRSWMKSRGFTVSGPWKWSHAVAGVTVDLSVQFSVQTLQSFIGLACHNARQGWRAWVFERWLNSNRHELRNLGLSVQTFRTVNLEDTRAWILSGAPAAATVGLGATYSPATYAAIPSSDQSCLCPRQCGALGSWNHITWECRFRPPHAPLKPQSSLLSRFGWAVHGSHPQDTKAIRTWLAECQQLIWNTKAGN